MIPRHDAHAVSQRSRSLALATVLLLTFGACLALAQQKVIRLYDGPAPGSETWKHSEKERNTTRLGTIAYNVVDPTLTLFEANRSTANGTAVVICPGGAMFLLAMEREGVSVARALNAKGVTCFVLKYRLVESKTDNPMQEWRDVRAASASNYSQLVTAVMPLAVADALQAMKHVRTNAKTYGINPRRIGMMGFSAGGAVTACAAHYYSAETRPDFLATIYLGFTCADKANVPADAPPLFIAVAADDELGLAPVSVDLWRHWNAAKKPAELHVFAKGGHGFGMKQQNLPTDHWLERFTEWLAVQGLLPKSP